MLLTGLASHTLGAARGVAPLHTGQTVSLAKLRRTCVYSGDENPTRQYTAVSEVFVREFSVPSTFTIPEDASAVDSVFTHAANTSRPGRLHAADGGTWVDVTAADFAEQVTAVAKGLIASGVKQGDRVALMSATRYEWPLIDFAIWAAGGVTVPIYETSAAEQVRVDPRGLRRHRPVRRERRPPRDRDRIVAEPRPSCARVADRGRGERREPSTS